MLHSKLPPSSAARRLVCPGSRALEEKYPREESESSREGRAAHWVAFELLQNGVISEVDDITPDGDFVTQEMIDGAEVYADIINKIKYSASSKTQIYFEERVNISSIHKECWGTCDCYIYDPEEQELYVIDYKFGHKEIDAFENYQLIEYTAGILDKINKYISLVSLNIVQPRNFGKNGTHNKWETTPQKLQSYFNALRASETAALSSNAQCTPSPECTFCSARHACIALQQSASTIADVISNNQPLELTPQAVGSELRFLKKAQKELDARITGLEEHAVALITSGKSVPYFSLEQGKGRDKWTASIDDLKTLEELFDCKIVKEQLITPKQAIDSGIPEEVIKQYYDSPRGSFKLTEMTEKEMRKLFGGK